ncbi:hypothetical protein [Polynucleobacter asymbioticus]|uniref:hypothetical protein n=1 Tax=Polynucleobacter asymbioticus TaxID=576611 RepID=UPI0008F97010|nr:hypothetical protein [Polynucleobacter asymbioticus]
MIHPINRALRIIGREFGDLQGDALAIAILLQYHPAFQPKPKPKGRKVKWTPLLRAALAANVDYELNTKKINVIWLDMADDPIWSQLLSKANLNPRDVFQPQYILAKRSPTMADYEFAMKIRKSSLWDEFLKKCVINQNIFYA